MLGRSHHKHHSPRNYGKDHSPKSKKHSPKNHSPKSGASSPKTRRKNSTRIHKHGKKRDRDSRNSIDATEGICSSPAKHVQKEKKHKRRNSIEPEEEPRSDDERNGSMYDDSHKKSGKKKHKDNSHHKSTDNSSPKSRRATDSAKFSALLQPSPPNSPPTSPAGTRSHDRPESLKMISAMLSGNTPSASPTADPTVGTMPKIRDSDFHFSDDEDQEDGKKRKKKKEKKQKKSKKEKKQKSSRKRDRSESATSENSNHHSSRNNRVGDLNPADIAAALGELDVSGASDIEGTSSRKQKKDKKDKKLKKEEKKLKKEEKKRRKSEKKERKKNRGRSLPPPIDTENLLSPRNISTLATSMRSENLLASPATTGRASSVQNIRNSSASNLEALSSRKSRSFKSSGRLSTGGRTSGAVLTDSTMPLKRTMSPSKLGPPKMSKSNSSFSTKSLRSLLSPRKSGTNSIFSAGTSFSTPRVSRGLLTPASRSKSNLLENSDNLSNVGDSPPDSPNTAKAKWTGLFNRSRAVNAATNLGESARKVAGGGLKIAGSAAKAAAATASSAKSALDQRNDEERARRKSCSIISSYLIEKRRRLEAARERQIKLIREKRKRDKEEKEEKTHPALTEERLAAAMRMSYNFGEGFSDSDSDGEKLRKKFGKSKSMDKSDNTDPIGNIAGNAEAKKKTQMNFFKQRVMNFREKFKKDLLEGVQTPLVRKILAQLRQSQINSIEDDPLMFGYIRDTIVYSLNIVFDDVDQEVEDALKQSMLKAKQADKGTRLKWVNPFSLATRTQLRKLLKEVRVVQDVERHRKRHPKDKLTINYLKNGRRVIQRPLKLKDYCHVAYVFYRTIFRNNYHFVRAFMLYHMLPYNRSVWGKWQDPVFVFFKLVTMIPFFAIRPIVMSFMLLFLLTPQPGQPRPDEYQLQDFILQFKGMQFITGGMVGAFIGVVEFYMCNSSESCHLKSPGNSGKWGTRFHILEFILNIVLTRIAFYALINHAAKHGAVKFDIDKDEDNLAAVGGGNRDFLGREIKDGEDGGTNTNEDGTKKKGRTNSDDKTADKNGNENVGTNGKSAGNKEDGKVGGLNTPNPKIKKDFLGTFRDRLIKRALGQKEGNSTTGNDGNDGNSNSGNNSKNSTELKNVKNNDKINDHNNETNASNPNTDKSKRKEKGHQQQHNKLGYLLYYDRLCVMASLIFMLIIKGVGIYRMLKFTNKFESEFNSDIHFFLLSNLWGSRSWGKELFVMKIFYSLTSVPFFFFIIPGVNRLLTHAITTGWNRNGRVLKQDYTDVDPRECWGPKGRELMAQFNLEKEKEKKKEARRAKIERLKLNASGLVPHSSSTPHQFSGTGSSLAFSRSPTRMGSRLAHKSSNFRNHSSNSASRRRRSMSNESDDDNFSPNSNRSKSSPNSNTRNLSPRSPHINSRRTRKGNTDAESGNLDGGNNSPARRKRTPREKGVSNDADKVSSSNVSPKTNPKRAVKSRRRKSSRGADSTTTTSDVSPGKDGKRNVRRER